MAGTGVTQKGIILFLVGLVIVLKLIFLFAQQTNRIGYSQQEPHGAFIPKSPHSHGEMDQFKGPEESVDWNEAHFHSHAGMQVAPCINKFDVGLHKPCRFIANLGDP